MPDIKLTSDELRVFLACTQRFDDIVQRIPIKVRTMATDYDRNIDLKKALGDDAAVHAVIRYFNLCAEEHYLNKCGLITPEVWTLWRTQITAMCAEPFVAKVWESVKAQYAGQSEFYDLAEAAAESQVK